MDKDAIPNFLDNFSSRYKYGIPIHVLWAVTLSDGGALTQSIRNSLRKIDHSWAPIHNSDMWTDKGNILVAQEITLPGESFEVTSLNIEGSSGAYMPGYAATKRSDFLSRNVTINFLETNVDIESQLFRPWSIALSVEGLINTALKTTINVYQYDSKRRARKEYIFYDAFPTNCETTTINYTDDPIKTKTVTFAYSRYEVKANTGVDNVEVLNSINSAPGALGALDLAGIGGNIA
jgi:hypothetical protein